MSNPTRSPDDVVVDEHFDVKQYRRILASSFIGSTVEFYDFLLYGTAAALVFGPLFFSDQPPAVALIASFATFTVGYLARPVGSLIFGHIGDRVGRKKTLVTTMIMMGVASTAIGILPTSEQVGFLAPVLLLLLRLIQGIAVGGEWGGAALMGLEHAPKGKRGFAASMANMGGPAGSMLATLIVALFSLLPKDQFLAWGWRIPFLISAILVIIALFIRLRISESPMFVAAQQRAEAIKAERSAPIKEVFSKHLKTVVVAALAGAAALSYSNFMGTFAISMASQTGTNSTAVLLCKSCSALVHIFSIAYFARLSDRVGRKKVMLLGCVLSVVLVVPMIMLLSSGNTALVLLGFMVGSPLIQGSLYGPLAAYISEQFSTGSRYTGAGLTYQIATVIASFSPLISSVLWATGQDQFGKGSWVEYGLVPGYLIAVTLVSFIAIAASPDTRDLNLVDAKTAAEYEKHEHAAAAGTTIQATPPANRPGV